MFLMCSASLRLAYIPSEASSRRVERPIFERILDSGRFRMLHAGMEEFSKIGAVIFMVFLGFASSKVIAEEHLRFPFSFEVISVETTAPGFPGWSVIKIDFQNGPHQIRNLTFYCEVKTEEGYSWDVEYSFVAVSRNAKRELRVGIEDPDTIYDNVYTNPVSARCVVVAFERSAEFLAN